MHNKIKLSVFSLLLFVVIIAGQLQFYGCAGSGSQISPEREQAIRDSLRQVLVWDLQKNMSIAMIAFQNGEWEKAAHYYNIVLKADTIGAYTTVKYQNLAHCYVNLSKPDSATIIFREGIKRYPEHAYFYNGLGYILRRSGETEEAIDMYEKYAELRPDELDTYNVLADLYRDAGNNEQAIAWLRKLVDKEPENLSAREKLSELLRTTGDVEAIIAQQRHLVEQDSMNLNYRRTLAETYYNEAQYDNAIEQLEFIISIDADDVVSLEKLADCHKVLKQYDEAVVIYNRLIKLNPQDKKNMCQLALVYVDLGRYTQALRQADKALSIDRNYGLAYLTKGIVYETAAQKCIEKKSGKIDYSDKLVFQMAYDEFEKAQNDLSQRQDASRHLTYLQDQIPTTGDRFMHKKQTRPEGDCYNWIK
ncbi:tetratricopeptide repeat protein [bacterium]|nr:tetratricopeptide repeat protein [bacterium]